MQQKFLSGHIAFPYPSFSLTHSCAGWRASLTHLCVAIWLCFLLLSRTLVGNYVNFGVFELYGDQCLSNALTMVLKLAVSIPGNDLLVRAEALV